MTNGLDSRQAKWLTYLVYFLLALMGANALWGRYDLNRLQTTVDAMPDKYVRLERYRCDIDQLQKLMQGISVKLDRVIETKEDRK